jgi:plasmid stabilization system protein ParE
MENGYKILWTTHALEELAATYDYLETNFTFTELNQLSREIEKITFLISQNPKLFPKSQLKKDVRKVVVLKYNTLFYRIKSDAVEILSFFSNRQDSTKLRI